MAHWAFICLPALAAQPTTLPVTNPITLHLKDASPKTVIAELGKQTKLRFQLDEEPTTPSITIDLDHQPFWPAFREICAKLHLSPGDFSTPGVIGLDPDDSFNKPPSTISGPVLFLADSIERITTAHASGAQRDTSLDLTLTAFVDPALPVRRYNSEVQLIEAIDDHGNSLVPAKPAAPERHRDESAGEPAEAGSLTLSVSLHHPEQNPGSRITRLKGTARFWVQTRSETWQLDDPVKAKDATHTAGGYRQVIGRIVSSRDGYRVDVTLHREDTPAAEWSATRETSLAPMLRLLDRDGNPLTLADPGNIQGNDRQIKQSIHFSTDTGPDKEKAGPPARLEWQIPLEVRACSFTFEFKDLPMP